MKRAPQTSTELAAPSRRAARRRGRTVRLRLCGLLLLLRATAALAGPRLEITPSPLILPAPSTGESRGRLQLRNLGDTPLLLYGASLSPDANGYHLVEGPGSIQPGEALAPGASRSLEVAFVASPGRPRGYGAVLVYSNDPGGQLDPRGQTPHRLHAAALRCNEPTRLLWLCLSPLPALALALWRRRRAGGRGALGRLLAFRSAWGLAALLPLAAGLAVAVTLVRGFGVLHGDYGVQFLFQRVLSPRLGWVYQIGLDGGSLLLGLALSLWGALCLGLGPPPALRPAVPDLARPGFPFASLTLLLGAGLAALLALDLPSLLSLYGLAILAALGSLPVATRRRLWLPFLLGPLGLIVAAVWLASHSLPTLLPSGGFVAHSTDVVKLSYQNYFGDLQPPGLLSRFVAGPADGTYSPWATVAYFLLAGGALLPLFAVSLWLLRSPLPSAGRLLLLLPPLAILGFAMLVRLAAGLLPQAHSRFAAVWAVLAVCGLALASISRVQPGRREAGLEPFAELVLLPLSGALLGLASATETGLQAALLLLFGHALSATWLGLRLLSAEETAMLAGPPPAAPPIARVLDGDLRLALLLVLGPPGTLLALGHALCGLAAFAALRGLATVYALLVLTCGARALLALLSLPRVDAAARLARPRLAMSGWLIAASVAACFCAQPLFEVGHTWAQDFLAHTRHDSGPPAPGLLARFLAP